MSNLSKLLEQLKSLQIQIEDEIKKSQRVTHQSIHRKKLFPEPEDGRLFRKDLPHYDNPYYLLTITFSPEISNQLDEYGQTQRLKDSLQLLDKYVYYSCLEKHKSGVLHAHALIITDYHDVQEILHKIKRKVTKSIKLEPAIKIIPLKKSPDDLHRSFNYIVDDKPDHPLYKKLIFNI